MNNFNLTKYLADNPLLKEGLAKTPLLKEGLNSQEKGIVDDILSVTEGPKDVFNKLSSYGKKGLISLAILTSVLAGFALQGDKESSQATIEYAIENDWVGSDIEKLALTGMTFIDSIPGVMNMEFLNTSHEEKQRINKKGEGKKYDAIINGTIQLYAWNYFYDLLDGTPVNSARDSVKNSGASKKFGDSHEYFPISKEEILNYIGKVEAKLESNTVLSNKLFYNALQDILKNPNDPLNPKFKKSEYNI
tara:strand:+ start:48 stop:791 length:744 start_codon:yes stop_codon:yes gene_type:complete